MRRHLVRSRHSTLEKIFAVLFLAAFEVSVGIYFWDHTKPSTLNGYLIKNGDAYVVLWKNDWNEDLLSSHASISDALRFAEKDLGLHISQTAEGNPALEHMWLRSDIGKTVLYWKTLEVEFLNRLTFKKESDALLFERIFRSGGYTPSPYGHAISLMPFKKG